MQRWRRCSRLELDMAGATPDLGSSPARRQPIFLDRVRGRWFGAVVHYPNSWTGYLRYCLVFALIAGLGGLSVLGHASLPDSLGLPGIYDDADYDDVVALLTDTASLRNFRSWQSRMFTSSSGLSRLALPPLPATLHS
jgi:hypothetical protein